MKQALIYIPIIILLLAPRNSDSFEGHNWQVTRKFRLQYVRVGFGSNMFEMQPVFNVDETKFVYTSEVVWVNPKQKNVQDTLLIGIFRISSMDSISNLIRGIKDSRIYRTNIHILSGSASYITVQDDVKKIMFDLHNASDTTAARIIAILNTYIPDHLQKLHISNWTNK